MWVETGHPRFHEVNVTWRTGGPTGPVIANTGNRRNLDLEPLNLAPGTVLHAEVRDPVGPTGIDWVRNPSTNNSATDSGFNGPRYVQTRTWTVGDTTVTPRRPPRPRSPPTRRTRTRSPATRSSTSRPTTRTTASSRSRGRSTGPWSRTRPTAATSTSARSNLPGGTHTLTATVTDGARVGHGRVEDRQGRPDRAADALRAADDARRATSSTRSTSTAGTCCSTRRTTRPATRARPPSSASCASTRTAGSTTSASRSSRCPTSPFQFRHSGTVVKALTYGNLGTGGLSRATFEQTLPDNHPSGRFIPGFGTHFVEHRAIDPAGNYGMPGSYRATVLPGSSPACTTTLTGSQASVNADHRRDVPHRRAPSAAT